jgi:hypothetical protein
MICLPNSYENFIASISLILSKKKFHHEMNFEIKKDMIYKQDLQ